MPGPGRRLDLDLLIDRALDLPRPERLAFIRAEAGSDAGLLAAAERVLQEDEAADGFLAPGGALSGPLADDLAHDENEWGQTTLDEGVSVGPYRVDRQIGRGGMGEVYRARDQRLGRDVALKILPRRLAADPDRVARFGREARALAAVSHPGVAAIYDVHEEAGLVALVLELVDGPTLAERIAQGPVALADTIAIARGLVDAMAAAHDRGIVHRDLKPANIKAAIDGSIKVLDFGLARAIADEGPAAPATSDRAELVAITTMGAPTGDVPHRAVLGTASYMSPEQARGQRVDHRTDIWAFGCVLFELLAGARAFGGETTPDVIARVLEREPDYAHLPPQAPRAIERLVRRCLQKDVDQRLTSIADARFDLDEAAAELRGAPPAARPRSSSRRTMALAAAAIVVVASVVGIGLLTVRRAATPPPVSTRLAVPLPASQELVVGQLDAVAVSSDGRTVVYRAREDGVMKLFVRRLSEAAPREVPGAANAAGHAVSPDGRFVAFGRDGKLFKAALGGGTPVTLTDAPGGASLAWAPDDTILFATPAGRGLQRVSASGGPVTAQTTLNPARGDRAHNHPAVSPDGDRIAFTVETASKPLIALASRDGAEVAIVAEGRQPQFLTADVLVFAREASVWAVPLDRGRRAQASEPIEVLHGVDRSALNGFVHYAVSPGSIVYIPERPPEAQDALVWVDRRGREQAVELEARHIVRFAVSRDEARLALAVSEPDNRDVWVYDRARRTLGRLTRDPAPDTAPVWSPDGKDVAFRSDRDGGGIFIAGADGASEARRLTHASGLFHTPYSFTPDGARLLYVEFRDYRDQHIFSVTTKTSAPQVEPVLTGAAAEVRPAISPDGRWLAYQSDESGRFEVYVRPFPDVTRARWQVSTGGGSSPVWRADGRELFYAGAGQVMAAATGGGAWFEPGAPAPLFAIDAGEDRLGAIFDVSRDGQRFLVRRAPPANARAAPQLHVILDWRPAVGGRFE